MEKIETFSIFPPLRVFEHYPLIASISKSSVFKLLLEGSGVLRANAVWYNYDFSNRKYHLKVQNEFKFLE